MRAPLRRWDFPWKRVSIELIPVLGIWISQMSLQQGIWELEGTHNSTYWLGEMGEWEGSSNYITLSCIILVLLLALGVPLSACSVFPTQSQHGVSAESVDLAVAFHLTWYYSSPFIKATKAFIYFLVVVGMGFAAVDAPDPLSVVKSFLPCFIVALYSISSLFPTLSNEWAGRTYADFQAMVYKNPDADEKVLAGDGLKIRLRTTHKRIYRAIAGLAAVSSLPADTLMVKVSALDDPPLSTVGPKV